MEELKDTLACNLRTYRKLAKLSQEKLGEACGLHRTYIGGIEQGRINVSLKNIGKIALALHINPVFLFVEPSFAETMSAQWEADASAKGTVGQAGATQTKGKTHSTNLTAPDQKANSASTANTANNSPLIPGGYALCTWQGNDVQLDPIDVDDPDLAISILVALIDHGHTDDLAQAFEAAQGYISKLTSHARLNPRAVPHASHIPHAAHTTRVPRVSNQKKQ